VAVTPKVARSTRARAQPAIRSGADSQKLLKVKGWPKSLMVSTAPGATGSFAGYHPHCLDECQVVHELGPGRAVSLSSAATPNKRKHSQGNKHNLVHGQAIPDFQLPSMIEMGRNRLVGLGWKAACLSRVGPASLLASIARPEVPHDRCGPQ
jgi:hypothetical protein